MRDYFVDVTAWGIGFLGFFGGIALIVWASNTNQTHQPDPQVVCIQQRGSWAVMPGKDWQYTCKFDEVKK